jgi:hypothetical protein
MALRTCFSLYGPFALTARAGREQVFFYGVLLERQYQSRAAVRMGALKTKSNDVGHGYKSLSLFGHFFPPLVALFRGVFQYGLLHFGQTFGSSKFPCRGTQVCSHLSH